MTSDKDIAATVSALYRCIDVAVDDAVLVADGGTISGEVANIEEVYRAANQSLGVEAERIESELTDDVSGVRIRSGDVTAVVMWDMWVSVDVTESDGMSGDLIDDGYPAPGQLVDELTDD